MKKTIVFDITHYSRKSGFGRVTKEIINRFIKVYGNKFNIILVGNNLGINNISGIKIIDIKSNYILFKLFYLNKILKKYKGGIFFSFDNIFFGKVKGYKYITIIHDIGQERWYKKNGFLYYLKKKNFYFILFYGLNLTLKNFNKSNIVIVPSEYTKLDLIDFYKLNKKQEDKIKIIKWGVDHFGDIKINKKDNDNQIILFPFPVLTDNKIIEIIEIINNLKDFKIYFLGVKGKIKEKILNNIINKDNIIFDERYLNNNDLIKYFSKNNICIYISDNDGFGFLPLECQYFGNPVLATNGTSIPYILGNSVKYINSDDTIQEILKKIDVIKNNYFKYSKKSLENSNKYKWDKTIQQIYKLI